MRRASGNKAARGLVAGLVAVFALALSAGCGGSEPDQTPVVVLISDVSGSTKELRGKSNIFKNGISETIQKTAQAEGQLWATRAEAAVIANSTWLTNGKKFEAPEGGDEYQKEELAAGGSVEDSKVNGKLRASGGNPGSDLLGALNFAENVFKNYPNKTRDLVLLTDGGINSRGVDWMRNLPTDPAKQDALVKKLKASGELSPNGLTGGSGKPVNVWIGGLGYGLTGNGGRDARSVRELWAKLIEASGGKLVQADSNLNLINFPQG